MNVTRMIRWIGIPSLCLAAVLLADSPRANAQGISVRVGSGFGSGIGFGTPYGFGTNHHSFRPSYGISPRVYPQHRSYYPSYRSYYPHGSHFNYYAPSYVPHRGHFHYAPGFNHFRGHHGYRGRW